MPRYELAITVFRFLVLVLGLKAGIEFFWVVAAQTAVQVGLGLGPALWVMVRELGHSPHFQGARWIDYKALGHISLYVALIQISVVLADRIDTTVLGFLVPVDPEAAITVYSVVSKPFVQLRQTGWMLAYMVMPAVASLAAAHDVRGLDRVKYDGTRLHIGVLLPIGLLGLDLRRPVPVTVDRRSPVGCDSSAGLRPVGRSSTDAAVPGRDDCRCYSRFPCRCASASTRSRSSPWRRWPARSSTCRSVAILTVRLGVEGVIWGTVLTTLFSNLLVPGVYVFRVLEIDPRTFLKRTMSAPLCGAVVLMASTWLLGFIVPVNDQGQAFGNRMLRLLVHLLVGTAAYASGYLLTPVGRRTFAKWSPRCGVGEVRPRPRRPGWSMWSRPGPRGRRFGERLGFVAIGSVARDGQIASQGFSR